MSNPVITYILIPIATSLVASFLTIGWLALWRKCVAKQRLKGMAGDYNGYGLGGGGFETTWFDQSRAKISPKGEGKFKISVKHGPAAADRNQNVSRDEYDSEWQGDIVMQPPLYVDGDISWWYENRPQVKQPERIFGFKRCLFNAKRGQVYFRGLPGDGYGLEVFEKQKRSETKGS